MGLTLVAGPEDEPLTTSEAKTHLRVDHSTDDTYIGSLITAARQAAENFTRRVFIAQTWDLTLDAFPCSSDHPIYVPLPTLQSVTYVRYVDTDGVTQTWSSSNYTVDIKNEPGRIIPAYGQTWPTTRDQINAVTVRFIAGYGTGQIPKALKQAMLLLIGHYYERREESQVGVQAFQIPMGAEALMWNYRVLEFY